MLGDKSVYGEFPVTIDDKNRMIIPARTGIEYNEDILIVSINSNRYVVSQRVFDEYINKLDESIATAPTELDFRSLHQIHHLIVMHLSLHFVLEVIQELLQLLLELLVLEVYSY